MSTKSKIAFEFSVEAMNSELYFWTFTFVKVLDIKEAARRWRRFLSAPDGLMAAFPFVHGLRVFELHPGNSEGHSHGLHIHMILNERIPVDIVRTIATRKGFGRIHVMQVPRKGGKYLAKYLGKERPGCFKGMRLWAPVGDWEASKVRNIEFECDWTRSYRLLASTIDGFKKLPWRTRQHAVTLFLWKRDVYGFLKVRPPRESPNLEVENVKVDWDTICAKIDGGEF